MGFEIFTTAFPREQSIPEKFTCKGPDVSPALRWTGAPSGTQSYALVMDDPDAPAGVWVHWVVWNIPPSVTEFMENVPKDAELKDGTRQGKNSFGKTGYNGPCPPPGQTHRYYFRVYALNAMLDLKPGATAAALELAVKKHLLDRTEIMGKFSR